METTLETLALAVLFLTQQTQALEQQILSIPVAHAQELVYIPPPPEPPTAPGNDLKALSDKIALQHGVSASLMRQIVAGESSWRPKAVGDSGKSHGLVQIHSPSHPHITRAQAQDPTFALTFLASNLAKGNCKMWSACRKIKGI